MSKCTLVSGTGKKVWRGVKEDGVPAPLGVSPESWPNKTPQELGTSMPDVRMSVFALEGSDCPAKQSPGRIKLSQVLWAVDNAQARLAGPAAGRDSPKDMLTDAARCLLPYSLLVSRNTCQSQGVGLMPPVKPARTASSKSPH